MRQIANMTVIRGNGECRAYMNGVVQEEIRRQQARMRGECERARTVEASRNRLLADRCHEYDRMTKRRPISFFDRIENTWCMVWAVLICWGEALGLWVREE